MAKFEMEMELTGLKIKIKGEREDIPRITSNLSQQIAGMLTPAANIATGQSAQHLLFPPPAQPDEKDKDKDRGKGRGRRRNPGANGASAEAPKPIGWRHDPGKWGNPRQAWKAWQKILWLMYVADQETSSKELSAAMIADAFNTHFRQAGLLRKNNMPRDLGALKQKSPALVSDHAEKSPITWFLTEEGIREATKLVIEAKGTPAVPPAPAGD